MPPKARFRVGTITEGNIGSFAAILDRNERVLIAQERKRPHRFAEVLGKDRPHARD
jgi:hypothetical protein